MVWQNLLKNKCPKCGKELDYESDRDIMMCTISCGFMITARKMQAICLEQSAQKLKPYEPRDNFQELQNFGREKNPFDDSDEDY